MGIGIGAAAVLAVRELRRAGARAEDLPLDAPPRPHKLALRDGEEAARGVRRMTLAQLDLGIQTLAQSGSGDFEQAVHETRKAIKRARTLERLMADASGRTRRRQHRKEMLRQAAGELSGARETQVALNTLEGLMRRRPKQIGASPGVAKLHAALLAERTAAQRALQESGARERALRLLEATRADLAAEPARGGRRQARALSTGAIGIYTRGRKAMRAARRRPSIAEMHEWRKRVKDLRHATEALGGGGGAKKGSRRAALSRISRDADRLGEALGEEHDLALLAKRVRAEDAVFRGDKAGRKRLQAAIKRRRRRLRTRALRGGAVLYRAKPRRLRKRLPKRLSR